MRRSLRYKNNTTVGASSSNSANRRASSDSKSLLLSQLSYNNLSSSGGNPVRPLPSNVEGPKAAIEATLSVLLLAITAVLAKSESGEHASFADALKQILSVP